MAKAWRNLAAQKVNTQRYWELLLEGKVKTPKARQQARARHLAAKSGLPGSTWLLDGLLIRAGIIDPLPAPPIDGRVPGSYRVESKPVPLWQRVRNFFK
jgi:hypothetical protein